MRVPSFQRDYITAVKNAIRRTETVVGCFPDGESALMLVAARLRHVAGTKWGARRYLEMGHLQDWHGEWVDLEAGTVSSQH
jgi:hypothetical protein